FCAKPAAFNAAAIIGPGSTRGGSPGDVFGGTGRPAALKAAAMTSFGLSAYCVCRSSRAATVSSVETCELSGRAPSITQAPSSFGIADGADTNAAPRGFSAWDLGRPQKRAM